MSRVRKTVLAVFLAAYVFSLAACFPSRVEASNQHAPIDLTGGQRVERVIVDRSTVNIARFDYGWLSHYGETTWSDDVVEEIENFLGVDTESNLTQISADAASWYWGPETARETHDFSGGSDGPVFSRKDTIVILGLHPTLALRIERPTEFAYHVGYPWRDPKHYWGWGRFILSRGMADGVAIPIEQHDKAWPYKTEIIVPAIGFRESIDLSRGGVLRVESWSVKWDCLHVPPGYNKIVFDVDLRAQDGLGVEEPPRDKN